MSIDFGLLRGAPRRDRARCSAGLLVLKLVDAVGASRARWAWTPRQRWLFAALLAQGGEFAFVVFGAARIAGVLSADWAGRLTIAVALSMALTPLHAAAARQAAGAARRPRTSATADAIDEDGSPVIIAGFGRFGQIVGRLLFANGIRAIVLDHDPEQIDLLRKFGYKVFYGDATRLDLLRAAGAGERAAAGQRDRRRRRQPRADRPRAASTFPTCRSSRARATSRTTSALRTRGVTVVERETFESALRAGRRVLEALGRRPLSRARDGGRLPAAQRRRRWTR